MCDSHTGCALSAAWVPAALQLSGSHILLRADVRVPTFSIELRIGELVHICMIGFFFVYSSVTCLSKDGFMGLR